MHGYPAGMKSFRKVITMFALVTSALFVLAACQGTRTLESIELGTLNDAGEFVSGPIALQPGDRQQLHVRANFDNGTADPVLVRVDFTSSDTDVIVMDGFTAVAQEVALAGTAVVTATHDGHADSIMITVSPLAPAAE